MNTLAVVGRRTELREAIIERDARREAVQSAQQAEQRGHELLIAAETQLSAFGDVDAVILRHRAGKIKDAAQGGPPPDLNVPVDLASRKAARDEVREHVAAAKSAHDSLVADLTQAETVLRRAEQRVSEAAVAILVEEGILRSAALKAAWENVWSLQDELNALAGSWLPGPVRLPADAVRVMQSTAQFDHRQFAGGRNVGLMRAGKRWGAWHEALCKDANAPMPEAIDSTGSAGAVESAA